MTQKALDRLVAAAREHGGEKLVEVVVAASERIAAQDRETELITAELAEGRREAFLAVLERRFGALDPALAKRIRCASSAELQRVIDRVFWVHRPEHIFYW